MKIAYIGTYPPRKCGIGTFTENLCKSIALNVRQNTKTHASVIAINDSSSLQEYDYPPEVKFVVRQNYREDYINAAEQINLSNSRACILNHEFGIFGGDSGLYILSLTDRLKVPLAVVFHTVLKEPSFLQKNIIRKINETAAKIVVMSNKAVELLIGIYDIPPHKIEVIEHGVPDYQDVSHDAIKKEYNLSNRNVLLTFGFLGRNKGIETVIDALPAVVQKHPSLLYIILGATHPNILKYSGEEYRNYLNKLVRDRKLQDNVIFLKSFVTEDVLFEYLRACDIYIAPYNNKEQITSGTLAYAVGAGAAVLSTPYWHAEELLADGRGRLFDFKKPEQLSDILNELLDHPEKMNALREKAYNYGIQLRWPTIGKRYLKLLNAVKDTPLVAKKPRKSFIEVELLPEFTLDHVKRLTDDTGIVQHARYGIPNLKEGYCLDDNARALLMSLMAYGQNKDPFALDCMRIYLSYIQYMQTEQGTFRNFLSFRRDFLDKEGSEDSFGRTIWALGYLLYDSPNIAYREFGKELFDNSRKHFSRLEHLRGIADTIIGISYYLRSFPGDESLLQLMKELATKLTDAYFGNRTEEWQWFEPALTYDNAVLPLSLFHATEISDDAVFKEVALKTTAFLEEATLNKGYLSPIGSYGWYTRGGERAMFDQQAIDVMGNVQLYFQAFNVTRESEYFQKMFQSFLWFLGENDLRVPLYDYETGGCCDGLKKDGVNRNQGAESTLAYLISYLTVLKALEYEL